MSAFYVMRFMGRADTGVGALYIGHGVIVGADAGNGRYHGTYTEQDGHMTFNVRLSNVDSGRLVTGQLVDESTVVVMTGEWPADFASGQHLPVMVSGQPVTVILEKVGDVP